MNTLAIDIGTHTGWAANNGSRFEYGMELLCSDAHLREARKIRLDRRCDPRIPALRLFVEEAVARFDIRCIVFEDVLFIKSRAQAHLWASQRAVLWLIAAGKNLLIDCLNTTALKTFATGQPSADKGRMLSALKKADPGLDFGRIDDNVADAIWLWRWARERIRP
jgi:Holliday junction resolvasome RuvABC endonuclease subunit